MMKRFFPRLVLLMGTLFLAITQASANLPPPSQLCNPNKHLFMRYQTKPNHKAFAVSADGSYGWSAGENNIDTAKNAALAQCQKHAGRTCRIYSVDDELFSSKK